VLIWEQLGLFDLTAIPIFLGEHKGIKAERIWALQQIIRPSIQIPH
jgi:hypothetical protein